MRRKLFAWMAAVLIVAAVAACFLRPSPLPQDDSVYRFSEPFKLELSGRDADRFEAYITVFSAYMGSLGPDFFVSVRSLDGSYYTLGKRIWYNDGGYNPRDRENTGFGYVEKLGESGWEEYMELGVSNPATWGGVTYIVWHAGETAPEEHTSKMYIPYWTPGHYKVTLFAREYILTSTVDRIHYAGFSGDELYEFSFEYDVPERGDEPLDVMLVHLDIDEFYTGEPTAVLNASLRANGAIRYIQPDTMKLERLVPGSEEYVEVIPKNSHPAVIYRDYWTIPYADIVQALRSGIDSSDVKFDLEDRLSVIPLHYVELRGWNTKDEYRFSVDFAENEDGSGERYTLELRLRFSK